MLTSLTLSLPDWPKPSTLLFYSVLHQTILLVKGEPLGGKGLKLFERISKELSLSLFLVHVYIIMIATNILIRR